MQQKTLGSEPICKLYFNFNSKQCTSQHIYIINYKTYYNFSITIFTTITRDLPGYMEVLTEKSHVSFCLLSRIPTILYTRAGLSLYIRLSLQVLVMIMLVRPSVSLTYSMEQRSSKPGDQIQRRTASSKEFPGFSVGAGRCAADSADASFSRHNLSIEKLFCQPLLKLIRSIVIHLIYICRYMHLRMYS